MASNVDVLANQLRGIRPGNVTFATVPISTLNYLAPTGQSAVLWNRQRGLTSLFAQLKNDQPVPKAPRRASPGRKQVSVDVS